MNLCYYSLAMDRMYNTSTALNCEKDKISGSGNTHHLNTTSLLADISACSDRYIYREIR